MLSYWHFPMQSSGRCVWPLAFLFVYCGRQVVVGGGRHNGPLQAGLDWLLVISRGAAFVHWQIVG